MKAVLCIMACCLALSCVSPARAAGIKYFEDPVYVKINKDDEHPMDDLVALAEQGDPRAQFILGDLYGKGKGGLGKNRVKARYWFEVSARHGYTPAFIRLAALARHEHDDEAVYKWYTLSIENAPRDEAAWSKKSRDLLVKAGNMSRSNTRAAEKDAGAWLDNQKDAMRVIEKTEQDARDKAPPDGSEPGKTPAEKKTPAKEQPEKQPKQEYHYNE